MLIRINRTCRYLIYLSITMSTLRKKSILLLLAITTVAVVSNDTIKLCACPGSPCYGLCRDYKIGECQQFDQCFDERNGIFGYVIPEMLEDNDEEVVVTVYTDDTCTNIKFDPSSTNGFQGLCDNQCWSSTTSNIGAAGCFNSSQTTSPSSSNHIKKIADTIELCACPESPCYGKCRDYKIGECQQFDQCFDERNGIFGYVIPEMLEDNDEEEVVVTVYTDETCTNIKFDPSIYGWQGLCDNKCWSTVSKVGAGGCFNSSETGSSSSHHVKKIALSITFSVLMTTCIVYFNFGF